MHCTKFCVTIDIVDVDTNLQQNLLKLGDIIMANWPYTVKELDFINGVHEKASQAYADTFYAEMQKKFVETVEQAQQTAQKETAKLAEAFTSPTAYFEYVKGMQSQYAANVKTFQNMFAK